TFLAASRAQRLRPSFPTRRSSDLDHRAIDEGLVRTAQRVAKSNAATPWADELRSLSEAVSADAAQLDAIREAAGIDGGTLKQLRSEEHTSELQSRENLVCRLLLEK